MFEKEKGKEPMNDKGDNQDNPKNSSSDNEDEFEFEEYTPLRFYPLKPIQNYHICHDKGITTYNDSKPIEGVRVDPKTGIQFCADSLIESVKVKKSVKKSIGTSTMSLIHSQLDEAQEQNQESQGQASQQLQKRTTQPPPVIPHNGNYTERRGRPALDSHPFHHYTFNGTKPAGSSLSRLPWTPLTEAERVKNKDIQDLKFVYKPLSIDHEGKQSFPKLPSDFSRIMNFLPQNVLQYALQLKSSLPKELVSISKEDLPYQLIRNPVVAQSVRDGHLQDPSKVDFVVGNETIDDEYENFLKLELSRVQSLKKLKDCSSFLPSSSSPPPSSSSSSSSLSLPEEPHSLPKLVGTDAHPLDDHLFDLSAQQSLLFASMSLDLPISSLSHYQSTIRKQLIRSNKYEDTKSFNSDSTESSSRRYTEGAWLNADLTNFNVRRLGKFDVILVDPPWHPKGQKTRRNKESLFFNYDWAVPYNTLRLDQLCDIDVGSLSDHGFIFLWVLSSDLESGLELLKHWGYVYVDRLIWIKKTVNQNLHIGLGYYFLHCTEVCLFGRKTAPGKRLDVVQRASSDVIFSEYQGISRKPELLYRIIEEMVPGGRKLELFARNHNIRRGWLSVGNELGPAFDRDSPIIYSCARCSAKIVAFIARLKSKSQANYSLCQFCGILEWQEYREEKVSNDMGIESYLGSRYWYIKNAEQNHVHHRGFPCEGACSCKMIHGPRFSINSKFNGTKSLKHYCESCFNSFYYTRTRTSPRNKNNNTVAIIEVPDPTNGDIIHQVSCRGCNSYPIHGHRFVCMDCTHFSLCQSCFFADTALFTTPLYSKTTGQHSRSHRMEVLTEPLAGIHERTNCTSCTIRPIIGIRYKCTSCLDVNLCEECYKSKPKLAHQPTHKFHHTFEAIPSIDSKPTAILPNPFSIESLSNIPDARERKTKRKKRESSNANFNHR